MMKRLLNLILALNLFSMVQAQEVELSFSVANNDFGEVLIDGETSGTLTITNNTVYTLSVSLSSILNFSEIPGYSDVSYGLGKCNTPYTTNGNSNIAYNGFYFVHPSTELLVASHSMDVAPGTSTIEITFAPSSYRYSYITDYQTVCVQQGPTGCESFIDEPFCENVDKDGLGSYIVVIRANYVGDSGNIRSATDIEIDGEAVNELSTVNSVNTVNNNQLVVSPNPASDIINVDKGELTIMNSNGEVVLTTISDGQVDVSFLEAGFYIVSLDGKTSKLVIK